MKNLDPTETAREAARIAAARVVLRQLRLTVLIDDVLVAMNNADDVTIPIAIGTLPAINPTTEAA